MNYKYRCSSCEEEYYIEHSMKEDSKTTCIRCSHESLSKVIEVAHFHFKGEGWASKEIRALSCK